MGLSRTITALKVYAARETVVGLWEAVSPSSGDNDLFPFVARAERVENLASVDELHLGIFTGSPWHTEEVLGLRMRLVAQFSDGTFEAFRIAELTVGAGEAARLAVRALGLDSDLAEHLFQFVNAPSTLIGFRQPLVGRTLGDVLQILFDDNHGLDAGVHKLGTIETSLAGLNLSILVNHANFLEIIRLIAEEVRLRHGLSFEYETAFDNGAKTLTYNFFEERGWSASERTAGTPDPTLRPIDAPTGGSAQSEGNRLFTRWSLASSDLFTTLYAQGGREADQINLQRIFWDVASALYNAGQDETTVTLSGDPLYKDGAYAPYTFPLPPAGVSRCFLANDLGLQYAIIATSAPGTVVVVGDASAETSLRFMLAVREVAFVEDHQAASDHGDVARFMTFPEVVPFDNLFGSNGDLSAWSGGLPDGIEALGAATITEVTDELYVEHGTSAMKVQAATDEGARTHEIDFTITNPLFPYLSFVVLVRVEQGRVRFEITDSLGVPHPQSPEKYEGVADGYFAVRVGGIEANEGNVRLVMRATEDATVFYVDAISITNSVGPWDYAQDMGPKALWQTAAAVLLSRGGARAPVFETRLIDISDLDPAKAPIKAGSHARLRDLFDGAVFQRIATGRCQQLRELMQGEHGTPLRQARFASTAPSVATRLAFTGPREGAAGRSGPRLRRPDTPELRRPAARYPDVPATTVASGSSASFIQDADLDTGVYAERTEDKDTVEFFTSGAQRAAFASDGVLRFNVNTSNIEFVDSVEAPTKKWLYFTVDQAQNQLWIKTDAGELFLARVGGAQIELGGLPGNELILSTAGGDITLSPGGDRVAITHTGALTLPGGTTAARPAPQDGDLRYNTTLPAFEGALGGAWVSFLTASGAGTDEHLVRWDGTSGLQNAGVSLSDGDVMTIPTPGGLAFDFNVVSTGITFNHSASADSAELTTVHQAGLAVTTLRSNRLQLESDQDLAVIVTASTERVAVTQSGLVGIGTVGPTRALEVVYAGSVGGLLTGVSDFTGGGAFGILSAYKRKGASPAAPGDEALLLFEHKDDAGARREYAAIGGGITTASGGLEDGYLTFETTTHGSVRQETMRLSHDGRLLVGVTAPADAERLHVSGNTMISGYVDFDEMAHPASPLNGKVRLYALTSGEEVWAKNFSGTQMGFAWYASGEGIGADEVVVAKNIGSNEVHTPGVRLTATNDMFALNDLNMTGDVVGAQFITAEADLAVEGVFFLGVTSGQQFTINEFGLNFNVKSAKHGATITLQGETTGGALVDFATFDPDAGVTLSPPNGVLTIDATGAVTISAGTTAQRPGTPAVGMLRYNTTLGAFEGYDGAWQAFGGGDAETLDGLDSTQFLRSDTSDAFTGSALTFTDNAVLEFGAPDFKLWHDGTNNILDYNFRGFIISHDGETMMDFEADGSLRMRWNGLEKLSTQSGGITITGNLEAGKVVLTTGGSASAPVLTRSNDTNTGLYFPALDTIRSTVSGVDVLEINGLATHFFGNRTTYFGSSNQLRLSHDAATNQVRSDGLDLVFKLDAAEVMRFDQSDNGVEILHGGGVKLFTTATGVEIDDELRAEKIGVGQVPGGSAGEIRAAVLNRPVGTLVLQGQAVQLGGANPTITQDDTAGLLTIEMGSTLNFLVANNLPTSDPGGTNRLWRDGTDLKIT